MMLNKSEKNRFHFIGCCTYCIPMEFEKTNQALRFDVYNIPNKCQYSFLKNRYFSLIDMTFLAYVFVFSPLFLRRALSSLHEAKAAQMAVTNCNRRRRVRC